MRTCLLLANVKSFLEGNSVAGGRSRYRRVILSLEGDFVKKEGEKRAKAPSPHKNTLQRGKKDPILATPTRLGRVILSPEGDLVAGGWFRQVRGRKANKNALPGQKYPPAPIKSTDLALLNTKPEGGIVKKEGASSRKHKDCGGKPRNALA